VIIILFILGGAFYAIAQDGNSRISGTTQKNNGGFGSATGGGQNNGTTYRPDQNVIKKQYIYGSNLIETTDNVGQRHCFYDDKAYSEGAIVSTGNIQLLCGAANTVDLNGQLIWKKL
jgi:hypothetical protein